MTASPLDPLRRFLLHLRLPFNYVLAPLFVWGGYVSGAPLDRSFWLGFVAFHLFLYGGTNMFNSYYDRDSGPIGGLARPPAVDRGMLRGSLALKAAGLGLAAFVGAIFAALYLAFVLYSVSYSHPAIRLKRRPVASAASVFVGQGLVGFLAGWAAAAGALPRAADPPALAAALGAALLVSSLYPVTQIYQLEADAGRGDLTLARRLGPGRVFVYVFALLVPGLLLTAWVFKARGAGWAAAVLVAALPAAALALAALKRSLAGLAPPAIYRRAMAVNYATSTLFLLLMAIDRLLR